MPAVTTTTEEAAREALANWDEWHLTSPWFDEMNGVITNEHASALAAALRALVESPTDPYDNGCEHDWRMRVAGGSLCSKCNLWIDERFPVESPTDEDREALLSILAGLDHEGGGMMRWHPSGTPTEAAQRTCSSILAAGFGDVPWGGVVLGAGCHVVDVVSHRAMVSENRLKLLTEGHNARWLLTSLPSSSSSGN